jgi:amino acid adenylation domain-containing protein
VVQETPTFSPSRPRAEDPGSALSLYHLLDQQVLANPYPLFHRLRREDPVHWDPFLHAWVVTRYADVLEVLHTFSADRTPAPEQLTAMGLGQLNPIAQVLMKQMLFMDAPAHTRLRGLASKAFTPARIEELREHIREIVDRLLEGIEPNGGMDVVAELAEPLPAIVTAEMMGLPVSDWKTIKGWSANFAEMLGNFQHNPDHVPLMLKTVEEMTSYFREQVHEIKLHPRAGLIHSLLTAEVDGDRLTEEEVVANAIVTVVGGQETTTNLIGNGLLTLLRNPEQLEKLRRDPALVPSAVEEMLRYESPSQHTARLAPCDRELGGKNIQKRQAVIAVMAAANRDPERFPDPDTFDIARSDNRHLAFGYAAHFCFGAPLARMEGQIAFEGLLRRFPSIQLEPQPLVWRTNLGLRGLTSLRVSFEGASHPGKADGVSRNERSVAAPDAHDARKSGECPHADIEKAKTNLLERYLSGNIPENRIPRRFASEPVPLSFAQEQIWLHSQIAPDSPLYNEPVIVYRDGPLDLAVFERSLTEVVRRHEAWRTNFDVVNGQPVQIIGPAKKIGVPLVDLRGLAESAREEEAKRLATVQSKSPFDLKNDSLLRVSVLQLGESRYQICFTLHHIIFDGLSIYRVFLPELLSCYRAYSNGGTLSLPELPLQYGDYAAWSRKSWQGATYGEQVPYWRKQLEGAIPVLQLPTDHTRPAAQRFQGAMHSFRLSRELSSALHALSRREGATLFMTLLAAFASLLHRYSGQNDFVVGTVSAGRKQAALERLLGCFQNPLALRMDLTGDPTFRELMRRAKEVTLGALSHDDVPFGALVKELHPDRDFSRNPLLQVLISLAPPVHIAEAGWDVTQMEIDVGASKFDLDLELDDRPSGLRGRFVYNTDLFEAATVARMVGHWERLLEGLVANPDQWISVLPLLTDAETRQIAEWNRTEKDYPRGCCIHELVEAQVERAPEAIAVRQEKRSLTYRDLNTRANQLAHYLRKQGVGSGVRVGICLESSPELVVALLGVLKAGGACVPLDPNYPAERLAYMLEDAQASVLIARGNGVLGLEQGIAKVIDPVAELAVIARENAENPANQTTAEDLAYVIYTSGSTGKPRGVQLTHRGLVNHGVEAIRLYGLTPADRVLQFSSISFDIAVEEILPTWMSGATLVLKTSDMPLSAAGFLAWIRRRKITVLDLPTAYWHELVHQMDESHEPVPTELRLVIVGGEKASVNTLRAWRKLTAGMKTRWINTYGPTETSVIATAYEPGAEIPAVLPIGRPIANTQVHVLDRNLRPVPVGVSGELHIGGLGVARGYLNLPEQTEQKFIADPFREEAGARLYKTGDMGKYLPSGEIEFLGRTDDQIKIHGFRVELGEVEAVLGQHGGVHQPVVTAREDTPGAGKSLVAYFVAAQQPAPTALALRSFLKDKLPEYMVPAAFVALPMMPLTPNGKVDRRALPAPKLADSSVASDSVAPKDELESRLVKIWESILGKQPITVRQNFFELGGHSLLAVRLMHRVEQVFGKRMPIATLFQAPTIEQLADLLRDGWSPSWSSLVPIQPNGSKIPFFCIHGAGGTVIIYHNLAKALSPDQPIYGLQAQGLDGKQRCLDRVEDMAEHYLKEIRTIQPTGPYFLGGLSFGGTVAYEIAQRLRAAGEEVGPLVLFDTFPGKYESSSTLLKKLWRLPLSEKTAYLGRKTAQYGRTLGRRLTQGLLPEALKRVRHGIQQAGSQYSARPYEGPVVLFRASQKSLRGVDDPYAGWKEFAVGGLEIYEITGDHVGIVAGPQVGILAQHLKACLERSTSFRSEEQLCAS